MVEGGLREGGGRQPALSFRRDIDGGPVLLKERSEQGSRESGIVG